MKGRSHHRLQSSDPPDDWVDDHWTVDCICGVNFDDGEEMVKCDECDVWVHTRCSRYVKGDDMFACDKCKSKSNRTDTEETEVAEVLAGLTTKTMRMKSSFTSNGPSHRPFKLWTDIPIEDRVHVQGIPGGDPSLFGGVSSVFSPELWKCTGYVPKKFNFQYREFPCWDDSSRTQQENENPIDKGAGVLFSFSKECVLATPVAALVGMRAGEEDCFERKTSLKEMNKCDNDNTEVVWDAQNAMKERSLLRPVVMHSGKRKKEDFVTSKDRSGKKRVKTSDKDIDPKRKGPPSSKSALTPTIDAKQLEFYEDIDPKIFKADTRSITNKNARDVVVQEQISDDYFAADTIVEEPKNNSVAMTDDLLRDSDPDMQRHSFPAGHEVNEDKAGHGVHAVLEDSLKVNDSATSDINHNSVGNATISEQEGDGLAVDNLDDDMVVRSTVGQSLKAFCHPAPEIKDNSVLRDFDCDVSLSSSQCEAKVKREGDDDNFRQLLVLPSSPVNDFKNNEKPSELTVNDMVPTRLVSCENKAEDVHRKSEMAINYQMNKPGELSGEFGDPQRELEGSEGSMEMQKGFPEIKSGLDSAEESSKSGALLSPPKVLSCLGQSLSSSSITNSKLPGIDFKPEDTNITNPCAKHGVLDSCNIHVIKECFQSDVGRDEVSKDEVPRKSVRERTKSSLTSHVKAIYSSRSTQNSVAKQISSDFKDSNYCSSSKASSVHQAAIDSGSSESNVLLHPAKASQGQNKISSSVQQRGEKLNQTNFQTSSKLNQSHVPSVNISPSSTSSAMLSDEELALLLHQELNSSPRVPRVPRARQAGSLPQLTSPSATSMLMKRTSSAGGKDHCLVSRRKYKDASRDGLSSSHELDDEAKRIEKVSSSCDQRKQDMAYTEAAPVKEEVHASMTAIIGLPSSVTANSSSPPPPESQNLSSIRSSPRNLSDDDTRTAGRPVHRTLPGLINEIMSKGRRMTYEELCNAVLPHWHNLRKHNGERYAYSSHSQAVLDCLRNRHEWARLVDRGPKTNSNRKRRKLDADESDENGYHKGRNVNEIEGKNFKLQKEEFPKGKRNARKRRRLALQGRAVKDVRKRHPPDSPTDEDVGPLSNSTEESMFSEDEIPCGKTYPAGSEAAASSDEAGSEKL